MCSVSVAFLDVELSRFISAGRLHCKIDKVAGIIETTRPDSKNALYQDTIKKVGGSVCVCVSREAPCCMHGLTDAASLQGDLLLNRIQKLSQVINI